MYSQYAITVHPSHNVRKNKEIKRSNSISDDSSSQDLYECPGCAKKFSKDQIKAHVKTHKQKKNKKAKRSMSGFQNQFWGWKYMGGTANRLRKKTPSANLSQPKKGLRKTKKISKPKKQKEQIKREIEKLERDYEQQGEKKNASKIKQERRGRPRKQPRNQEGDLESKKAYLSKKQVIKKNQGSSQSLPLNDFSLGALGELMIEIPSKWSLKHQEPRFRHDPQPNQQQSSQQQQEDQPSSSLSSSSSSSSSASSSPSSIQQDDNQPSAIGKKHKPITKKYVSRLEEKNKRLKALLKRHKSYTNVLEAQYKKARANIKQYRREIELITTQKERLQRDQLQRNSIKNSEQKVNNSKQRKHSDNETSLRNMQEKNVHNFDLAQPKLQDNPFSPMRVNRHSPSHPISPQGYFAASSEQRQRQAKNGSQ